MRVILVFLLIINIAFAAPWVDIVFGNSGYNYQGYQRNQPYRQQRRQGKGGKERWKEICRTINPDPFAFPGRAPYPAPPACPW